MCCGRSRGTQASPQGSLPPVRPAASCLGELTRNFLVVCLPKRPNCTTLLPHLRGKKADNQRFWLPCREKCAASGPSAGSCIPPGKQLHLCCPEPRHIHAGQALRLAISRILFRGSVPNTLECAQHSRDSSHCPGASRSRSSPCSAAAYLAQNLGRATAGEQRMLALGGMWMRRGLRQEMLGLLRGILQRKEPKRASEPALSCSTRFVSGEEHVKLQRACEDTHVVTFVWKFLCDLRSGHCRKPTRRGAQKTALGVLCWVGEL